MEFTIIISMLIVGFIMYPYLRARSNKKSFDNYYNNVFLKEEKNRGSYQSDIQLMMDQENLSKVGYPVNSQGYSMLVKEREGVLHFNYPESPQVELLSIDYQPKYQNVKSGNVTKIGDNYINDTVTRRREINGEGLLMFKTLETGQKFIVKAVLNEDICMKLKSDFLKIN